MTERPHLGRVLKIVYLYARHDKKLRDDIARHLTGLQRQGLITGWHEDDIEAGGEREAIFKKHLTQADIILLLISSYFIASDHCYTTEMAQALEKHRRGEAHVLTILLRPTVIEGSPFASLRFLPKDRKPLATRKDRDAALVEIVQAIKQIITEIETKLPSEGYPSGSAGSGSHPRWWKVPLIRNGFFTGRTALLERLHAAFLGASPGVSIQALSGLGGIGKTQTALEYVYRYADSYQAVFWVGADPRGNLLADFAMIARFLDLPEKDEPDQALIVAALHRWFRMHTGWLLVFDNVEDMVTLRTFVPGDGQGHVLLTTRTQAPGLAATLHAVESLDLDEGTEFLLRRTRLLAPGTPLAQVKDRAREAAQELVRLFAGHPLALDQAGAYIEETGGDLTGYLALSQQRQAALLARRGRSAGADHHPDSLVTTFSLTFAQLAQVDPAAADLLRFCAFLYPDSLPEEVLLAGAHFFPPTSRFLATDAFELDEALATLLHYSLIRRHPATRTVSVHRLVQEVLKSNLSEDQQRFWAEAAVHALSQVFPSGQPETWRECQRYLAHARTCARLITQWQLRFIEAARLLNVLGFYLSQRAEYAEAQSCYKQALAVLTEGKESMEEKEQLLRADILLNLGEQQLMLAHYEEAERQLRAALHAREQVLGNDHPDLAENLNALAGVYHNQGQLAQAEPLYRQALALQERVPGPDDPVTARTLGNLALLQYSQKRYAESEELNKRALAAREKRLGEQHVETAQSRLNLAYVYYRQGRSAEAEPLFRRAVTVYEDAYGPEHPQTATALNGLALLLLARRDFAGAEPLFRRVRTIWRPTYGEEHPRMVGSAQRAGHHRLTAQR